MYLKGALLLIVSSVVSGQINGEFWWLNSDLTKLNHGTVESPTFDDVNELDTDETAKVVFKEKTIDSKMEPSLKKSPKSLNNKIDSSSAIHFRDKTSLANLFNQVVHINFNNKLWDNPQDDKYNKTNPSIKMDDEFRFIFPSEDNLLWGTSENATKKYEMEMKKNKIFKKNYTTENTIRYNDITSKDKNKSNSESICTFIKKSKCFDNAGVLYTPWMQKEMQNTISNEEIICCILPISTTPISKILFPDNDWRIQRHKRSNTDNMDLALKQRNTLMSRKYAPNNHRNKETTPATRRKVTQKVVTSDEYTSDPYWNIKNVNIRNPDTAFYQDPDAGYDDGSQSYGDDYAVELPKPGLIGLYSDHRESWMHNKNKGFSYDTSDSVEEEFEPSLGYSNIDPRVDQRSSAVSKPFRRRPLKLTAATSKESMHNSESPTISFHSNPDFQVLQGFKLLNLVRHKNRFVRKTPGTSEDCDNSGSKIKDEPEKLVNYSEDYEDTLFEENLKQKLYDECGKTVKISDCEKDKDHGVVELGAHPWIALVVSTKSPQNVLCYATLVHARAAVSVAGCVYGHPPGAVSVIAGVRNLDEDLDLAQRRMATIFLDSEYSSSGDFSQNLALLHWKLPFTLDARVQPACLADVPVEDDCVFVGWGGYDQEMHPDLRWQRASMLAPQNCNKRLSKLQLSDALCAAVVSRGTVTGIGGPMLCKINDRWSTIGVAVWRDDVIILLPPQEWVLRIMTVLRIQ